MHMLFPRSIRVAFGLAGFVKTVIIFYREHTHGAAQVEQAMMLVIRETDSVWALFTVSFSLEGHLEMRVQCF